MSADNYLAIRKGTVSPDYGRVEWVVMDGNASTGNESIRGTYKTRDEAIDAAQAIMEDEMIEYGVSVIEKATT